MKSVFVFTLVIFSGSFVFADGGDFVLFTPVISFDGFFDSIRQTFTDVMKNGYVLFISPASIWLAYYVMKEILNDIEEVDISVNEETGKPSETDYHNSADGDAKPHKGHDLREGSRKKPPELMDDFSDRESEKDDNDGY